jgi:hypothetical protein
VRRTLLIAVVGAATLAATTGAAISAPVSGSTNTTAHHHHHRGKFSCMAMGAFVMGQTVSVANKKFTPCFTKHQRVDKAGATLGLVKLGVLTANTRSKGHRVVKAHKTKGTAGARTAKVVVGLSGKNSKLGAIVIGAATSAAADTCVKKHGKLVVKQTHHSNVAYVKINGKKTIIGSQSEKIPLLLGTLYLNRVIKKGHTVTVEAAEIDLGGNKPSVILAESKVSYSGNPCAKKK